MCCILDGADVQLIEDAKSDMRDGWMLSVFKIAYEDGYGNTTVSSERLIFAFRPDGTPFFLEKVEGHTFSFQEADLTGENGSELAVFFHSGGNQYCVIAFLRTNEHVERLHMPILASNLRSIRITDGSLVVRNLEDRDGKHEVVRRVYKFVDRELILDEQTVEDIGD